MLREWEWQYLGQYSMQQTVMKSARLLLIWLQLLNKMAFLCSVNILGLCHSFGRTAACTSVCRKDYRKSPQLIAQ